MGNSIFKSACYKRFAFLFFNNSLTVESNMNQFTVENIAVVCASSGWSKPVKVASYTPNSELPDCIIVSRGKDDADGKWYTEVVCDSCGSTLLTRCASTFMNETVIFWCPVCEKESRYTNSAIKQYHPKVLRHPAMTSCTVM